MLPYLGLYVSMFLHNTLIRAHLHAASSTESSLARMPPILLNDGICIPYFSNSFRMLLISSSNYKGRKMGEGINKLN